MAPSPPGSPKSLLTSRLDKLSQSKSRTLSPRALALGFALFFLIGISLLQNQVLTEVLEESSASPVQSQNSVSSTTSKRSQDNRQPIDARNARYDRKSVPEKIPVVGETDLNDEEDEWLLQQSVADDPQQEEDGPIPEEDDSSLNTRSSTQEDGQGAVDDVLEGEHEDNQLSAAIEQDFPTLDASEEKEPAPQLQSNNPLLNPDRTSDFYQRFYAKRFLPPPQLDFFPKSGRQIKYQMHNCLKGRDGSKAGLLNAGIPRVLSQKSIENMPLHIIDPWASIMIACNAKLPMYRLTRNPDVAGKRLISSAQGLLSKLCLGSMKHKQLECRRALSDKWGCSYESLNIQPAQFILEDPVQCENAVQAGKSRDRSWLSKPSGGIRGRGIKYFANTAQLEKEISARGGCSKSNSTGLRGRLVQEYVSQPALIDGKFKFDVRTWLLIASVDPLIIFYHEGFVRVARQPYNERSTSKMVHVTNARGQEERLAQAAGADQRKSSSSSSTEADEEDGKYMRSFDHVSEQLHRVHGLPKNFMKNEFRKQMMRAQTFAALAQYTNQEDPPDLFTKKGFYQIYACDSMVDRTGKAHLLECNGFPAESQQTAVTGREVWGEMIALILNLHLEPWRLMKDSTPPPGLRRTRYIRDGVWKTGPASGITNGEAFKANEYAFGGWHLTFNELETPVDEFNVCTL